MKNFLTVLLLFCFVLQPVLAAEFDASIDSDIRKQYNVDELPALPKAAPSPVKTTIPKEIKNDTVTGKTYTLKSRTKIALVSKSDISNWNSQGTKVSFLSQNAIATKEGVVIPSGTLFKAVITDSHLPQMTGNGGLIELKVNEIYYNGIMSVIDSKLSEANSKIIFKNDIKGKRKYWQNCSKAMTPGRKTFNAMRNAGRDMASIPVLNILSIVPFALGGAAWLVNASIAPVASVFMKGGSINLPAGTVFIITVLGDNKIQG